MCYKEDDLRKHAIISVSSEMDIDGFCDFFFMELTKSYKKGEFTGLSRVNYNRLNVYYSEEIESFAFEMTCNKLVGIRSSKSEVFSEKFGITKEEMPFMFYALRGIENMAEDAKANGEEFLPKSINLMCMIELLKAENENITKNDVWKEFRRSTIGFELEGLRIDIGPVEFMKWFLAILSLWDKTIEKASFRS